MSVSEWWRSAAFYQIYVRSFQDSNGDGIGDLPGIRSRLPYLKELGVDALWLTPFYPSPQADHGYDVADYVDVDPQFGTLDDFDALVADAHELGIRVTIDIVPNHTSDQHEWFRNAIADPNHPHRAYYFFRPGKAGGPPERLDVGFRRAGLDTRRRHRRVLPPLLRARAARPRLAQRGACRTSSTGSSASGSTAGSTASGSTWRTHSSRRRTCARWSSRSRSRTSATGSRR